MSVHVDNELSNFFDQVLSQRGLRSATEAIPREESAKVSSLARSHADGAIDGMRVLGDIVGQNRDLSKNDASVLGWTIKSLADKAQLLLAIADYADDQRARDAAAR